MIVFKKIEFLRPLLLHANTPMRFSEEPKRERLSVSAQKAAWATSIIETITKAKPPSTIRDPPLRDVILNLPDPSKEFHFARAEKNEVMKLFTEGIHLASPFLAQANVQYAQQKGDSHKSSDKTKKKFIFYPTSTATTLMFKQFLEISTRPELHYYLKGDFGIGKTISIILFIHLTYHQTRFIYEASKDEKMKEEYNKLLRLKLIPHKIIKYWYWSARNDTEQQIKTIILEQAVELEPAIRAKLKKQPYLSLLIKQLKNHYQIRSLSLRPIIDQVHMIAEWMRMINSNISVDVERIKRLESKLDKLFKDFLELGWKYTLSSSVKIERRLLLKGGFGRLGMDLVDTYKYFSSNLILYKKEVSWEAGYLDFWQTFWFEIERRTKLPPAQLKSAKQTFFQSIQTRNQSDTQKLKKSNKSLIYRFVQIRVFLSKNYEKLMKPIISQNSKKVQEIIEEFISFCFQFESKQKISNYLRKEEKRYYIFLKFYFKACSLKEKEEYRSSSFLLTTPQLEQILKAEIPFTNQPDDKKQQYSAAEGDLRDFRLSSRQGFKFIFSLQEFTVLVEQILMQDKTKYAEFLKSSIKKEQGCASCAGKTDLGFAAEKFLIDCLAEKGGLAFNAIQQSSNIETDKYFQISQVVGFDQLSNIKKGKNGQSAFEWHFRSAIELALLNPGKDILAIPYVITKDLRIRYASSHPAVDFAILRYDKQLNRIEFQTFDVTVSRDLSKNITEAQNLFTKLFKGTKLIKSIPFHRNHTILCTQDAINSAPSLVVPFTIMYADLKKLTIKAKHRKNLSMLYYIVKLITQEKEEEQYGALLRKSDW